MKILALEFSSPQRSVAALNTETGALAEAADTAGGHAMKPFALIDSALQQSGLEREQIEVVVVGLGPGSYTGIRAAIALAQGWQLACGVELCGISSALCMASQEATAGLQHTFNVVIDAQRGEFYLATYEILAGKPNAVLPIQIVTPEAIKQREREGQVIIGPEVTKWFTGGRQVFPRAATLARLASMSADSVSSGTLEPIYLRETAFVKTSGYLTSS
ncbi:MAG TPA: tRNA (adenosine(37)-N6)-threonylcarbamoyltransferase complex dimerization subunit type 1 TsaB [Verrucomicrobiae bacterium]|nr:tRNA (adenosine(37)-N6)-threonylcarbamoyltransferase complex dimerization subunit type 1 TsaB [Verrucomicrobiae bacterium]